MQSSPFNTSPLPLPLSPLNAASQVVHRLYYLIVSSIHCPPSPEPPLFQLDADPSPSLVSENSCRLVGVVVCDTVFDDPSIPAIVGKRKEFVKTTTLFPQIEDGKCRVCKHPVPKRRRTYCSDYCSQVAANVSKLFEWRCIRRFVARRDGECVKCGKRSGEYHIDHIVPVDHDGHPFDPENLQRLCRSCHEEKGMSHEDYRDDGDGGVRIYGGEVRQMLIDDFEPEDAIGE